MTILAALLLAAAQPAPTPAWLAGIWKVDSESSRQDEGACDGDGAMRWDRDGRFAHGSLEGPALVGDWHLGAAGRLNERPAPEDSYPAAPQESRVERLGANRMRLTDADGEHLLLTRCR